jgi:hypothetical protein
VSDFREQAKALAAARRETDDARLALTVARDREWRGARKGGRRSQAAQRALEECKRREQEILDRIGEASDPRRAVSTLSDSDPLLLLPVRLETRFRKIVEEEDGETLERRELWIRIYPDDCLVDAFEALPSDAEIAATKIYWQNVWRAGGAEAGQRSAWKQLVASSGAGRAAWLVRNYGPVNPADHPTKASPDETLLIAASEAAPAQATLDALDDYWTTLWLAQGDGARVEAARQALAGALGSTAAADAAIEAYKPFNIRDPVPESNGAPPPVRFTVVLFPDSAAIDKQRFSWGSAPKAHVLPDRFVALGFDGPPSDESAPAFAVLGAPIVSPLTLGIDPTAPKGEQLDEADGEIQFADELAWLVDFDKAVASGMGIRVPITADQAAAGFARLLVLGVRSTADAEEGQRLLEVLLAHHRDGRGGLALLAQGTPTNNVEERSADFRVQAEADASYPLVFTDAGIPVAESAWPRQRDGARLAAALGIDLETLTGVAGANDTDQLEARLMHEALFPGTLGYFLHDMIGESVSTGLFDTVKSFFVDSISGRGPLPAIRIGAQPYGILPATAFSRLTFPPPEGGHGVFPGNDQAFLQQLTDVLRAAGPDWAGMADEACWIGRGGDPHLTLLDTLGHQPASAEFYRRTAESIEEHLNRLNLVGPKKGSNLAVALEAIFRRQEIPGLLQRLGIPVAGDLPISDRIFSGRQFRLSGPIVDEGPLSETDPIHAHTSDGRNYLAWLADAALSDMDVLRQQSGFLEDSPPRALLYIILRFALLSGYRHEATNRFLDAAVIDAAAAASFRRDPVFVHVKAEGPSESRWSQLYSPAASIGGAGDQHVHELIAAALRASPTDGALARQIGAIRELAALPTARLERLFTEHVDCLSYRIDAWRTGLVTRRLRELRSGEGQQKGILLGAYGWAENLRPKAAVTPFEVPEELASEFTGDRPVTLDPANQGFVHAPSLDHAVTAAILRNGHISMADPQSGEEMAVNLSSERVRRALAMIQGMQEGQSLPALLGYQLERGLHERHPPLELDKFIQPLRNHFPLDRNPETAEPQGAAEAIAARNVVDGRKLAARVLSLAPDRRSYPYDLTSLPAATGGEAAAIGAEVDRLLDTLDAVSDLALAESVHQSARGNFERAAGILDAFSRGSAPPEPEFAETPRSGTSLTHRVAVHFAATAPAPPVATPRATAEPRLEQWLRSLLPPLADISVSATFFDRALNAVSAPVRISLADLKLAALDVLALVPEGGEQAMTALDELVLAHLETTYNLAADGPVEINVVDPFDAGTIALFEAMPLLSSINALLGKARPITGADLAPPSAPYPDPLPKIAVSDAPVRGQLVPLQTILDDCTSLKTDAEEALKPPNDPLTKVDLLAGRLVGLAERASFFGLPTSGIATVRDARRGIVSGIRTIASEIVDRWSSALDEANARLDDETALAADPASPADARLALLRKAEALISTGQALAGTTPDPAVLRPAVEAKRDAFTAKLAEFTALSRTSAATLKQLRDDAEALLPVSNFQSTVPPFKEADAAVARFCGEILRAAEALGSEARDRLDAAKQAFDDFDSAPRDSDRAASLARAAKAVFGDGYLVLSGVHLSRTPRDDESGATQKGDWTAAIAGSGTTGLLKHLVDDLKRLDPVGEWLAGIARVRPPMKHVERLATLAEAFGSDPLALTAFQLPYATGDSWLGAEFPDSEDLAGDRLLYSALMPPGGWDAAKPVYGLIIDEWVETLPNASEMTGLTFQFDRPTSEPPQSLMLLVPPARTGAWRWDDIVDAVNETFDFARQRAVEPALLDSSAYARVLPSILFATAHSDVTLVADLSMNNLVNFTVANP